MMNVYRINRIAKTIIGETEKKKKRGGNSDYGEPNFIQQKVL
jgi:hypothetical protein